MARFLDTNVLMYAAGGESRYKASCAAIILEAAQRRADYVTSVEVLQELIHRYLAIRRWDTLGRRAFDEFVEALEGRIEPVYEQDAVSAARLADSHTTVQGRDLFHVAVMQRLGVTEIISTDGGFDAFDDILRIDPAAWTPSQ
jgi:uncharacterized protein